MAKRKRRSSRRIRRNPPSSTTRFSRRKRRSGGGSRRGFAIIPSREVILGGAGAIGSAFLLPILLSKIPVAQLQTGWGNIAATGLGGAALGGLVGRYNKSVGLGLAIGAIASAGMNAIAMVRSRSSGVAGYTYEIPAFSGSGSVPLSGYGSEVGVAGYGNNG